jgi:hypothetical protein
MSQPGSFARAPRELQVAIEEFWPEHEWENAAAIAELESGFDAFAVADTTSPTIPCGRQIAVRNGVKIMAERSVGYFQINSCNFAGWEWQRFYNARHNAGTAHMLWENSRGTWRPWYFSATLLGLLPPTGGTAA